MEGSRVNFTVALSIFALLQNEILNIENLEMVKLMEIIESCPQRLSDLDELLTDKQLKRFKFSPKSVHKFI